jgi:hypothetical protein
MKGVGDAAVAAALTAVFGPTGRVQPGAAGASEDEEEGEEADEDAAREEGEAFGARGRRRLGRRARGGRGGVGAQAGAGRSVPGGPAPSPGPRPPAPQACGASSWSRRAGARTCRAARTPRSGAPSWRAGSSIVATAGMSRSA